MKMISAIIRESRLDQVREALIEADVSRITVSRVSGHGRSQEQEGVYRGRKFIPNLIPKVRIDIALNDEYIDSAIDAILKATKTGDGEIGDGKIFVIPIEEVIRIRTEEKGGAAV